MSNGTVFSCGSNNGGALGINGSSGNFPSPQQVLAPGSVLKIAAGFISGALLDSSGSAYFWGQALPFPFNQGAPVLASGITSVSDFYLGQTFFFVSSKLFF